jgi:hypothetical protein
MYSSAARFKHVATFYHYLGADDVAIVTAGPTSLNTTEEGATAVFEIVLHSQPYAHVTITGFVSSDTSEGVVSSSTLTFTERNWNIARTVTVTGVDDNDIDGDITYAVGPGSVSSSDWSYNGTSVPALILINSDGNLHADSLSELYLILTADCY